MFAGTNVGKYQLWDRFQWPNKSRGCCCNTCTVNPTVKTTCILRPPSYKDNIVQDPRCILSILLNLHIRPPVYKDHILLVPRVVFIYKFYCMCIKGLQFVQSGDTETAPKNIRVMRMGETKVLMEQ